MRDYTITIEISSAESEFNLDKDAEAAAQFLEDRGIAVNNWDLTPVDDEDENEETPEEDADE